MSPLSLLRLAALVALLAPVAAPACVPEAPRPVSPAALEAGLHRRPACLCGPPQGWDCCRGWRLTLDGKDVPSVPYGRYRYRVLWEPVTGMVYDVDVRTEK